MLKVLIVDDEPAARRGMEMLIAARDDLVLVGQCDDGEVLAAAVERSDPDILFLDVQMPGLNGFEALAQLEPPLPVIVFVTAYDRYAVAAFEAHAVDYVLKPYHAERFLAACDRAAEQSRLRDGAHDEALARLLRRLGGTGHRSVTQDRLVLRSTGRVTFVDLAEVEWMTGAGDYVRLHTGDRSHLVRETMRDLASRLEPGQFVRVHRSTIVRISAIRQLHRRTNGRWEVELPDGSRRAVSRAGRRRLEEALHTSL